MFCQCYLYFVTKVMHVVSICVTTYSRVYVCAICEPRDSIPGSTHVKNPQESLPHNPLCLRLFDRIVWHKKLLGRIKIV